MLLNEDIVDIENPDGTCSLTFVAVEFSELILHSSTLFYYTSKICTNHNADNLFTAR